jgi:N-alpha-acetyltransferase 50
MGKQELQVSFDEVREKNVEQLKMLNNIVFPIKFPVSASGSSVHCGEAKLHD